MHREKSQVEADEIEPKAPFAETLIEHAAGHLGEPHEEGPENREEIDADENVMDVGNDEIGLVELPIDGNGAPS